MKKEKEILDCIDSNVLITCKGEPPCGKACSSSQCATLNLAHVRASSKMFYAPPDPPPSLHYHHCAHQFAQTSDVFICLCCAAAPRCSICRIHLFKSFQSQLLSARTMAHCPAAQESHCPPRHGDEGTWMSTPTARQRRRIIMSGHGRLVKGERSQVRDGPPLRESPLSTALYIAGRVPAFPSATC